MSISPILSRSVITVRWISRHLAFRVLLFMVIFLTMSRSYAQQYTVNQSGTYNIEINNPLTIPLSENTIFSVPIGFNFTFFGNTYSSCYVSQNGFVTFSGGSGPGCCVGQDIPDPAIANNLIAAAWTDQDTAIIRYEVLGTSPNRRLIITLTMEDMCGADYYGQVKLFETTNVIEIHTQKWAETNTPCTATTQGLENASGNVAIEVPGRNSNNTWSVDNGDNDFVSFTPHEVYLVDNDANYFLEFNSPNDITIHEDGLEEVPMGFTFNFFGRTYTECLIGNNGFVTFGNSIDGGCCQGQNIPDPATPNNLIAAAWMDVYQYNCCNEGNYFNNYSYETFGFAPNRRFVVYYSIEDDICGAYYEGQIKLYEGSDIIEIHTNFYAEGNQPCLPVTQGIENATGTEAYYLDGRNANIDWNVPCCGDVVRFTPTSSLPPFDAGVSYIEDNPVCEGSPMINVLISNYGSQPLDSVEVHWKWDGVTQDPVMSYYNMPVGSGHYLIELDTQAVEFGDTYALKAWTSMPNGMTDGKATNDTMSATIKVGLQGAFTIGGSSPDYATFAAAITALQTKGICDSVIFNVRPGTYIGQISIPHIEGAFGDHKIIFQAENGDSSSVILQFTSTTTTNNYVLRLDNAHNIVWQKMTMKALGTSFARVIELKNSSYDNDILHCLLEGRNSAVTTNNFACIFSEGYNRNNRILKNTIRYGSFGFYHNTITLSPDQIVINENRFIDFYSKGIYAYYPIGIAIYRNILESTKNNVRGIEIEIDVDSVTVSHNKIYLPAGTHGIRLMYVDAENGKRSVVANNMVNIPGTSCTSGIELFNTHHTDVLHNTVNISIVTAERFAFVQSGDGNSVYNNIFSNKGGGPVISTIAGFTNEINFNAYFITGASFGKMNGQLVDDFVQWKAATVFDDNSFFQDPLYVSLTDLHVTNSILNANASPGQTTVNDFDLQLRNSAGPDIGADEFTPGADDAAVTAVLSPVISCDTLQDIKVVLTNLGSDTLESVVIKWNLNGIAQPDVNYLWPLLPEGDTAHVILTTHAFTGQPEVFKIWTTLPNGNIDSQPANDTFNLRYRLPLGGVYTIGGASPDFTTFKSAVDDLNRFHTCGPVTFRFRNGIYAEQVIIDSIPTTSAVNTITFESESLDSSAVTLQWTVVTTTKPYNILLNGTDYVTFRHLGFKSLSTGDAVLIEARNDAKHLTFSNNKLEGTLAEVLYANNYLFKSLVGNQEYLTFTNNYFLGSSYSLYIFNGIAFGNLTPKEFQISNNKFLNQKGRAIYVQNTDGLYIRNNDVTSPTNLSYRGIETHTTSGITEVSGNKITNINTGASLFMNYTNYTRSGSARVFNNMVRTSGTGKPFNLWNCNYIDISYNTVNAAGTGIAIEIIGGDTMQVKNNIFMSNSGMVYSGSSVPATISFDYNDVYSISGAIGYWNGLYTTMSQWQAGTSFDENSMNVNPEFVSSTDLHVYADTLNGAGIPISGITLDIDGQLRNAVTPDIGADEIGTTPIDAGIRTASPKMPFAQGLQDVKAVIRNFGSDTLMTATISWELNGAPQPDFFYAGPLLPLADDTVILGQFDFELNTLYNLDFWTSQPNQLADVDVSNDTLHHPALYAAVSGDVFVGATGDVPTIASAISAMNLGGIINNVRFRIQPGTYHTSISLPAATYQSCSVPIIFESATGNADDVIWDNLGTGTHTILLNGADGIHFRNLTIKTVINAIQAIRFQNASTCNIVEHCIIEGVTTTNAASTYAAVLGVSTNTTNYNHNNVLQHNTISNGSYNVHWDGATGTTGLNLQHNYFSNAYNIGVLLYRIKAPVLHGNTVSTNSAISTFTGIYVEACHENSKITANRVLLHGQRANGIYLGVCNGTASLPALVANNFVILGNSSSSYGNYFSGCNYINVFHNTIRITGGNNTGLNIWRQNGANINILNNILDNQVNGRTLYIDGTGAFTSNYNVHYSEGTNLIFNVGTNYTNLAAWQATGRDLNSHFEEPLYDSDAPFSYKVENSAFDGAGTTTAGVLTDIEGQQRAVLTRDIGCDEYDLFTHDVGLLSISYPHQPFPEGINTVFLKFNNNGEDTLRSMEVNWEINDISQPVYQWTGLLASAGTYDSLDIGEFNFEPGLFHTIKAWVSLPNGVPDELPANDTLTVDSLYPALSGVYTIGGTDPDFETITDAVSVLNKGGAYGNVTFNIRSGTYLDTLHIKDFDGSDCNNSVIFQSESGNASDVLITNLGLNAHTVVLDGADGVIFKNLSIVSVNTAYRHVVSYFNGAHCNQFLDNIITGFESNSGSASASVINSATGLDTANAFIRNYISYGSHSFYLLGNSAASSNTDISGNVMYRPYTRGVYAYYEYGLTIDNNDMTIQGSSGRGLEIEICHRLQSISGNNIKAPAGDYGMIIYDSDGLVADPAIIANNFISVAGTGVARGIYMTLSSYAQIVHNNIHVYSSNTSPTNTAPIYLTSCQSTTVINNALSNTGYGYGIYSNNNTVFNSNHNVIYVEGANLGYWNGIVTSGLPEWQSTSSQDANSMDVNPQFMSDIDLHVSNILLNGSGQTLPNITNDIDEDARSNPPDIGADEFDPSLANDAGVFMVVSQMIPFDHGNQPVKIAVKNYGSDTLNSVKIRWIINGIEQPVFNWSGALLSAQCDTVMVGNYNFASHSAHDLIFWTELPNNAPDSVSLNDTIVVFNLYPSLSGVYTVGGVLPDFNLFSQVEEALNLGGISGNVVFSIRNGTYASQLRIGDFPRTAPGHTVTFTAESGDSSLVTLTRNFTASDNYTVRFDDAHGIRFDHITLASTKGRIIDLINGSSRIEISNCKIEGVQLQNNSSTYHLIYSSTTSEDSITITNNHFQSGDYGIYMIGSSGDLELRHIISGNTFENCYSTSVFCRYTSGLQVNVNRIINTLNKHEAILVWNASGSPSVSRNDIRLEAGTDYAIYAYEIHGTASIPALINNNYIYINGSGTYTYGILQERANYVHYNYNTIRIENCGASSYPFIDQSNTSNIHIRNSIFANYSGGPAIHVPWLTGSTTNTLNYCNLFTTGSVLAHYNFDYNDHVSFQSATNQNLQGKNVESIFVSAEPDVFQAALDAAAIPISGVNTDIYGNARNVTTPDIGAREFTLLAHDIGARLLSAPETYCGLGTTEEITVRIQNYGSSNETGFNVAYSLDGAAWITENVGALIVTPGGFLDYTFAPVEDLSDIGLYHFAIRTSLGSDMDHSNDTTWNIEVEHIPALTLPATNLLPVDGQTGLETTVSLSWAPAPNATIYDIYLWVSSGTQPATPQVSNLSQINTLYYSLVYGEEYKWRVVAKNVCNQMVSSPVHEFTIRNLPNLQVDTVIIPATAFSGQTIEIEWQVRNTGPGGTQSTVWSDAVFLSTDATLNTSFDTYIGSVQNLAALGEDIAYTNTGEFTIPDGMVGNFYVFVQADRWNHLAEINNNNNWDRAPSPMLITLTPSPDLVVDEVTIPGSAFSGQSISVVFTVRNNGFGTADAMMWRDLISIGINPLSASGGAPLKNIVRAAHLQPDSTYEVTTTATIPQNISGDYYIYIHTDYLNQEYEFGAESNNTIISDTLEVFLTPPPDLIPLSITIPDTVSSNEILTMSWTVQNAGATGPTVNYWYDRIDLSPSPIYNSNFNTQLTSASHGPPLPPGSTYEKTKSITIPVIAHGVYYLYASTDIHDYVFEYSFESNNIIRRPDPVFIASPDVQPISLVHAPTTMSGISLPVTYKIINHGEGDLLRRAYRDKIYLSADQVLDVSDTEISSLPYSSVSILAEDTLMRLVYVTIPESVFGSYYLIVHVDANGELFEEGLDNNNTVSGAIMINIFQTPWPDLIPQNITVEDTVIAGNLIDLDYDVLNQGTGDAAGQGQTGIYYSFSPTWDAEFATEVITSNQSGVLEVDSIYSRATQIQLPVSIVSNVYYFYVWSDQEDMIFENGFDANNIQRSGPVFIEGFPPVDLVVDSVYSALDTLYTGGRYSHSYAIRNGGSNLLLNNTWIDRAYLSIDSILDIQLDVALNTVVTETNGIEPGESYLLQKSFNIPYTVSGDYYFFILADINDENLDINRSNNYDLLRNSSGHARKIHVILTPTPDVRIASFDAPSIAIAGQPALIEWETENAGTGGISYWVEKLFLSTDNVIGTGDVLLTTQTNTSILYPGDTLLTSKNVFLPAGANGNYVLILQTDANNNFFETNGENNNITLRSMVITIAPPSDLVVSDIEVPENVIAGENAVITWNTTNQGAFVAHGELREIVYLSADPVLDVEDEIFAIRDNQVYLTPQTIRASTQTAPVTGVEVGDYYALVQTDARDRISESNNANNVSSSIDVMNVDVKLLYIDSLTIDTLKNNKELYYKIEIPPTVEGYNLYVRLAGDTLMSSNELYARYGQVPSRAEFDIGFDRPLDSYQEFIIPNIQPGTYYIMAYGLHDTGSEQQVELYARLMTYSLLSVTPDQGGNEGFVTVTLKGSSLDSTNEVRLTDTLFNYIIADTFKILDESTIIARFNLKGVEPGVYTVQSTKPDDNLGELKDAFTVIEGGGPDLQVIYTYSPSSFFQFTPMTKLIVEGINNGDNDVVNEDFLIESLYGEQLSLTLEDYQDHISTSEIRIPIQQEGGFEGILAPGQTIRFEFPMRTAPYPLASITILPNEE